MAQTKKFCTNCGKPVEPGWKFCGACGQTANTGISAAPPAPPSPPPPAPPSPPVIPAPSYHPPSPPAESIIGVVPNVSRRKNILAVEGFNVIVTGRRLIFAAITNELIKEEAQRAREGGGFWGLAAAATAGFTLYKRYLTMPPEAALAETPANFALERASVRRVKLEAGKEINSYHSSKANQGSIIKHHQYGNGKFELETASGTLKFEIPNSSFDTASETLKKAGLYR